MAHPARDRMGAARESDLQERLRIEAVETLSHQLTLERRRRGRIAAVDVGIAAAIFGVGFGLSSIAGYLDRRRG